MKTIKHILSFSLCAWMIFALLIPAVSAAQEVAENPFLAYTFWDDVRGFVLILQMHERYTDVTDTLSIHAQSEGEASFEADKDRIEVVLPCEESYHHMLLLVFDIRLSEIWPHDDAEAAITVEGLQTKDGTKTARSVQDRVDVWMTLEENHLDKEWISFLQDIEGAGTDVHLYCVQGDHLVQTSRGLGVAALEPIGQSLTRNEDGSLTTNEAGVYTVRATWFGKLTSAWTVRVLTPQEYRDMTLQMLRKSAFPFMGYYIRGAAYLFSFPVMGLPIIGWVIWPLATVLSVPTAPLAYLAVLTWARFFMAKG